MPEPPAPISSWRKHTEILNVTGILKARRIDAEMVSWYGSRAIAGLDYLRRMALS